METTNSDRVGFSGKKRALTLMFEFLIPFYKFLGEYVVLAIFVNVS